MINQDDKWAFSSRFDAHISEDEIKTGFSRPSESQQIQKDFKKVYNDLPKEQKEENTNSPFDLAKTKKEIKPEIPQNLLEEAGRAAVSSMKGSLNKMAEGQHVGSAKANIKMKFMEDKEDTEEASSIAGAASPFDTAKAQPDLAAVSPIVGKVSEASAEMPAARTDLHKLVTQMIENLQTMEYSGKTDTTLTLRHPPIFEGSTLTLSAFDSAKGEFNVTFSNLNHQAKYLLDMQGTQDSLRQSLMERGYMMHIFIATTEKETPVITGEQAEAFDRQRREQGQQQQQQQQQNSEDQA